MASAIVVAALELTTQLEPVILAGLSWLIAKIRKKKDPQAAAAKAIAAAKGVADPMVALASAHAAVDTEPDDPDKVSVDEEWERDV